MALDRAIGAVCVGAVALTTSLGLVAGASTAPPERDGAERDSAEGEVDVGLGPVDDPATIETFLALRGRSEQVARVLEADWERRVDGEVVLTSPWVDVSDGAGNHLVEAFGNLAGVHDGRAISCGVVEVVEPPPPDDDDPADESTSEGATPEPGDGTAAPDDTEVDPFEVLAQAGGFSGCEVGPAPDHQERIAGARAALEDALAPVTGNYTVQRAPDRRLLGVETECFVLRRRGETGWLFGAETTMCWSPDAVPMLVERREGDAVDTRRTTSVRTEITDEDFAALLVPRQDDLAAADVRSAP